MGKRLFGTDGIRGVAGEPPLDPQTVTALGIALGADLHKQGLAGETGADRNGHAGNPDPRIAAQLAEGMARQGVAVRFAGVVTTPGVAYLTRTGDFAAGVMISASHNPFEDNGIKVFARTGFKLPDGEEHEIEEEIFRILPDVTRGGSLPVTCRSRLPPEPYLDFLLSTIRRCSTGQRW